MNSRIQDLIEQARVQDRGYFIYQWGGPNGHQSVEKAIDLERLVELIKTAIYDSVKEELIDDSTLNQEENPLLREYLKGCNGGTVDALCHIKNFGMDEDAA